MREKKSSCLTYINGTKNWWMNTWCLNGSLHREDGPAVEFADGNKAWYLNDKKYIEQDFYRELYKRKIISKDELFIHLL